MNKQKLAAKIWASANQMRSKIEANEFKYYILGFIFYKYLSEKELQFAKKEDFTDDDIKALSEDDILSIFLLRLFPFIFPARCLHIQNTSSFFTDAV